MPVSRFINVRLRSCTAVALLVIAAVGISGCKSSVPETPTGTVSGRVLLDDQPYTNATVVFLSLETGQGATGDIQSDGTYSLSAPIPVGSYQVFLAPKPDPNASDEAPVKIDPAVPEKYWNEAMTDISVEVAEGENDVTVPLQG